MKIFRRVVTIFLVFLVSNAYAQVTFVVQALPSYTPPAESLFIAGDFTGWEAGLPAYVMHKNAEGKWSITLQAMPQGAVIKFKFTRGSWATVEKGPTGEEIADRSFTFGNNDTVQVTISNWADAGGGGNSTAAANVKIISTDFYMPQLGRNRRIWLYYPPDYETSGLSYPVLYMHDGQNLFDATTSFSGEWEVDETLNRLAALGKQVPLVVGIDNGGTDRIGEYTPWSNSQNGGGDGEKYIQFIVETLKPYIDQHFRTLSERENTGIMGSSLGGLISCFGSLAYQGTFSKGGLFSPSYWFSDSIWAFTHDMGKKYDMRLFQLCGDNESTGMVGEMKQMNDSLVSVGFGQNCIFNKTVDGGQHNEKLWREAFEEAYLWLFDSYVNSVDEKTQETDIQCFPNPVNDILTLRTAGKIVLDSVFIYDIKGCKMKTFRWPKNNNIDVHDLMPGIYIIKSVSGEVVYKAKFIKN